MDVAGSNPVGGSIAMCQVIEEAWDGLPVEVEQFATRLNSGRASASIDRNVMVDGEKCT